MSKLAILVVVLAATRIAAGQVAVPSHAARAPAAPVPQRVATVNGVPVTSDRLDAALRALIPFESFHRSVGADKLAVLREKALQTVIDEALEYQDGVKLGIHVTAADVGAGVAKARARAKMAGASDAARQQAGLPTAALRLEIRRSLTIRRALDRAVTSRCQVGAPEAEQFFTANPDRFVVPEQLHLFAITIGVDPSAPPEGWATARARAEDLHRELDEGASFEELARRHSTDASKATGGDMGFVHRGSLNDEFEQALRDRHAGDVSDVVRTLYGYHLVRIAEIRAPRRQTFPDVSAEVQRNLTATRCADMKDAWIARLRASASITP
jgi:parvulin-like peptidyl-prolyl isomerase